MRATIPGACYGTAGLRRAEEGSRHCCCRGRGLQLRGHFTGVARCQSLGCRTTAKRVEAWFENDVFPYIGKLRAADLKASGLLKIARKMEERQAFESAHHVMQNCGQARRANSTSFSAPVSRMRFRSTAARTIRSVGSRYGILRRTLAPLWDQALRAFAAEAHHHFIPGLLDTAAHHHQPGGLELNLSAPGRCHAGGAFYFLPRRNHAELRGERA